eukprot:UC4_evm6s1442
MEDFACAEPNFMISNIRNDSSSGKSKAKAMLPKSRYSFYGVFDGHGGKEAASFCSTRLKDELSVDLGNGLPPVAALVNAYAATEVAWWREVIRDGVCQDSSGTTGVSVLVDNKISALFVANVGDSRALIIRENNKKRKLSAKVNKQRSSTLEVVALTKDHDVMNNTEKRRIKCAGGDIDEDGYINDRVQTARSLGDIDAKLIRDDYIDEADENNTPVIVQHSMAIVATPEIKVHYIDESRDRFLVLGCDGLFEESEDMNWIANTIANDLKKSPLALARALVAEALRRGSSDNVTAISIEMNINSFSKKF